MDTGNPQKIVLFGIDDTCPFFGTASDEVAGLMDLCRSFPHLKATHFMPANYVFRPQSLKSRALFRLYNFLGRKGERHLKKHSEGEFLLSNHPGWCVEMQRTKNFFFEMHGWRHYNDSDGSPVEFRGKSGEEIGELVSLSEKEFEKTGFEKPMGLAPPGWHVSEQLLGCLKKRGLFIAGSMHSGKILVPFSKGAGIDVANPYFPTYVRGVMNIPRNWDLHKGTIERAREIFEKFSLLSVHAHAGNIGVKNGLTRQNLSNLEKLLFWLENSGHDVSFMSFREYFNKKSGEGR